jgi:hypothetical protein
MSDDHADRNQKLKAAMREKETPLNKDGGKGKFHALPCKRPMAVRCRRGMSIQVQARGHRLLLGLKGESLWRGNHTQRKPKKFKRQEKSSRDIWNLSIEMRQLRF